MPVYRWYPTNKAKRNSARLTQLVKWLLLDGSWGTCRVAGLTRQKVQGRKMLFAGMLLYSLLQNYPKSGINPIFLTYRFVVGSNLFGHKRKWSKLPRTSLCSNLVATSSGTFSIFIHFAHVVYCCTIMCLQNYKVA